jgi:hypothetical protein
VLGRHGVPHAGNFMSTEVVIASANSAARQMSIPVLTVPFLSVLLIVPNIVVSCSLEKKSCCVVPEISLGKTIGNDGRLAHRA